MRRSTKYQDLDVENVLLFVALMTGLNRCDLASYPRGQCALAWCLKDYRAKHSSNFHCSRILKDDGKQNRRWLENSDYLLFPMAIIYNAIDLYSVIWMLSGNIQKHENGRGCIESTLKWLQLERLLLEVKTIYDENQLHIQEAASKQRQDLLVSLIYLFILE
jgi:hypothetical protein